MNNKYIVFSVDSNLYMIDIRDTNSIINKKEEEIKKFPGSPMWVKGLTSLRENLVLILDCRIKLGSKNIRIEDEYTVIVIKSGNLENCGVVVDEIVKIINIESEEILEPNVYIKSTNDSIDGVYLNNSEIILKVNMSNMFKINREYYFK